MISLWILIVAPFLIGYMTIVAIVNWLKYKSKSDKIKIGFFHPFWYNTL